MSNYKYNGLDIYYLLNNSSISFSNGPYTGFPISPAFGYTSGIEFPQPFGYQVSGVDLSNTNQAYTFSLKSPVTFTVTSQVSNSSPTVYYKHISGYCIGGAGGGGGGGGGAKNSPSHSGGNGAPGLPGGYAAVVQYPLGNSTSVTVVVGNGGPAGNAGNTGNNNGGEGGNSGFGGNSSLDLSDGTLVLFAHGGGYGNGGNGGNSDGNDGKAGTTVGNVNPSVVAFGGKYSTTDANTPTSPFWPPNNSAGGIGGTRGAGDGTPAATAGTAGKSGSAQIWFSYTAT